MTRTTRIIAGAVGGAAVASLLYWKKAAPLWVATGFLTTYIGTGIVNNAIETSGAPTLPANV